MTFLYQRPVLIVILMVIAVALAVVGLTLSRRFVLPHITYHEGVNDAISGMLGVIGVFYGITIGLIVIEVWQRHSGAENIVAREAAAIHILYLMAKEDYHTVSDPGAKSNAPDTAEPASLRSTSPITYTTSFASHGKNTERALCQKTGKC